MPNVIKLEVDASSLKQLESLVTKFKSGTGNGEDLLQAKKLTEERKRQIKLTEEEKQLRQFINQVDRDRARLATAFNGSLNEMKAKMTLLIHQSENLNQTTAKGKQQWDQNIKAIQGLDTEIKRLNAEMGRHQANVGNYSAAIKESFAQVGLVIAGVTAAYMAVNKVIGGSIKQALEAERAEKRLSTALGERQKLLPKLVQQSLELQKATGIKKEDIMAAQEYFAIQGRSESQIVKSTHASIEYAKVMGTDVRDAAVKIDATFEGNIGRLGRLDKRFKDLTQTQLANGAAVDLFIEKYGDYAESLDDTQTKIDKSKVSLNELKETFGGFILLLVNRPLKPLTDDLTRINEILTEENTSRWKKSLTILGFLEGIRPELSSEVDKRIAALNKPFIKMADDLKLTFDKNGKLTTNSFNDYINKYRELAKEYGFVAANAFRDELLNRIKNINETKKVVKGGDDTLKKVQNDFEKEYYKLTHTARANEINEITEKYTDLIEKAKKYGFNVITLQEQLRLKILEINKKYDEQDAEQLKKAQQEKIASMTSPEGSSTKGLEEARLKARDKENRDEAVTAEMFEKREKEKYQKITGYVNEYASKASDIFSELGGLFEDQKQREIEAAGNNKARLNQIEQEYAEKQKKIAIAQAILKLAQAQAAIIPEFVGNPIKALIDEAVVLSQFGLVMAKINSAKFAEGVIDLQGGTKGKDSILSLLMPGESVMTEQETKKHKPALKAIRENIFDEYIRVNYVIPELTKKANDDINRSTARNMYDGLKLKAELDDYELRRKLNKLDQTNYYLQSIDKKLNKSNIVR